MAKPSGINVWDQSEDSSKKLGKENLPRIINYEQWNWKKL